MQLRGDAIGALNLFSASPGTLSDDDVRLAQAMADIATIAILQERAIHDARALSMQLEGALASRVVIEQAKGIIAEHRRVDVDTAFTLLRGFARSNQRPLSDTAREVIAGTISPERLTI